MRIHMVFQKKITHRSWQYYSSSFWVCGYGVYCTWYSWLIFFELHRVHNETFEKFSYHFLCVRLSVSPLVCPHPKSWDPLKVYILYWRLTVNFISTFWFWISWKKAGEKPRFRYAFGANYVLAWETERESTCYWADPWNKSFLRDASLRAAPSFRDR